MPLHRAMKEQGIENLTFEVVKEFEFISLFNNGELLHGPI